MAKKVVVGMSGGVDSSVAAYLLKEQGYDVIGVTMQIWQDDEERDTAYEGGCCGLSAVDDARRVAEVLDIPYYVMNFRQEFKKSVIDYFVDEYKAGRTPNPCIVCNRHVKWEALLKRSLEIGADYLATGHYARIAELPNGRYTIQNSVTAEKDQSYALYNLTQHQLAHTLMPVGDYKKSEIREIAALAGLPVAGKHDSQDICFVPDHDYAGFIEKQLGEKFRPGEFVDGNGHVLGTHKGIIHYTVGQRRGLNLPDETSWFVKRIIADKNQVELCKADDLFERVCYIDDLNFMAIPDVQEPVRALGRIRYAHKGADCTLERVDSHTLKCTFDQPVRAITPGQSAVFMAKEDNLPADRAYILCGGRIK